MGIIPEPGLGVRAYHAQLAEGTQLPAPKSDGVSFEYCRWSAGMIYNPEKRRRALGAWATLIGLAAISAGARTAPGC